nr:hypothetical protein [Thiocapsa sp.]
MSVNAEQADRRRVQGEMLAFHERKPDPAYSEGCAELTMREERDRALHLTQPRDEPVGSSADVVRRIAARAAVTPDIPTRDVVADAHGAPARIFNARCCRQDASA